MMDGSALDLVTAIGEMNRRNYDYDRDRNDDWGFGGSGIFLLIILFFIMGAGGGFGGFGGWGGMNGAFNTLSNEFLYTNLNNTLDRGFNQTANQNWNIQKDLCQGFGTTQMEIMNNRFASQQCCCETNRNIDSVRYENAKNTCDIITANNAGVQKIIDYMQNDKIDQLRTQLTLTQGELSQSQQTQAIISQLRPVPQPAYLSVSPYMSFNPYALLAGNNGCGNGWNNGWYING